MTVSFPLPPQTESSPFPPDSLMPIFVSLMKVSLPSPPLTVIELTWARGTIFDSVADPVWRTTATREASAP